MASQVSVTSSIPGVCHVQLVFATGFTFTTDVTFASGTATACGTTVQYVGPSQVVFQVDNPVTTCLDGGPDAPSHDATVEAENVGMDDGGADEGHGEAYDAWQDAEGGEPPGDASSEATCPLAPVHCAQGHCVDDPPAQCVGGAWLCQQGPPSCYDEGGSD
jgi:hypothetical protein